MRQRYHVTISDYRGSRHFTLDQLVRRVMAGAAIGLAGILVVGAAGIFLLTGRVGSLNEQVATLAEEKAAIRSDKERLAAQSRELAAEVQRRSRELAVLGSEMQRIETLVGLEPDDDKPLAQRVDTAAQTAFEKRLMLRSIPSGFPVQSGRVTSDFGMRLHPIHDRQVLHGGVDLRAKRGTPIYATADGVVEWAAMHESSGLGKMVKLVHNYGFSTIYGHLEGIEVASGSYVKRGDLVGYSGNTGQSAAPHLHYEVRYLQRRLDPSPFLRWSLEEYDVLFSEEDRVQWESLTEVVRTAANTPERPSLQQVQSLSATLP
ncbi:MAG: peptidoglycan DD-metalloendopeptidase family protein [Gammaproteobacteria bacterium]|jgi:murein DD-endopeptidase MepM/ murein hydrolase activator NlpD|nr:peptidoglycan DD-metalloendopeptidase family protein [Gammaproteobacteria bacterium]